MMSIKAVFFDLDDTLFDHFGASRAGLTALHREHAPLSRQPFEDLEREYHRLLNEIHMKVLKGECTKEEARAERWRRLLLWCGNETEAANADVVARRYRELYQASQGPVRGATALMERLQPHVTIGIVTNNLTRDQEEKLRHCEFDRLIDFMVTSEDVGQPKPGAAIFEVALQRAGCQAGETVMVGDSWQVDVLGAVGAGIRAVWLNRHFTPCPDPSLAAELSSLEPVETALEVILEAH